MQPLPLSVFKGVKGAEKLAIILENVQGNIQTKQGKEEKAAPAKGHSKAHWPISLAFSWYRVVSYKFHTVKAQ